MGVEEEGLSVKPFLTKYYRAMGSTVDEIWGVGGNPLMCRPVVQKGEHMITNEQFMDFFQHRFAS